MANNGSSAAAQITSVLAAVSCCSLRMNDALLWFSRPMSLLPFFRCPRENIADNPDAAFAFKRFW